MAREPPFLAVLVTIVFIALGVLGLLTSLLFWNAELSEDMLTMILLNIVISIGFLVVGWGLYRGVKWSWYIAVAFLVLSMVGNYLYGSYTALAVDAVILVLLILVADYYGISLHRKERPTTPVPPPSVPVAAMVYMQHKEEKRFVKRKHRY